ncbi:hypothetical protein GBA52_018752 [Prunus armeniaca]|nr:hypothetical protein GBA52_018752 [Prunus armeniaca]
MTTIQNVATSRRSGSVSDYGGGKMKAKDESQMGKRIGVEARLAWFFQLIF